MVNRSALEVLEADGHVLLCHVLICRDNSTFCAIADILRHPHSGLSRITTHINRHMEASCPETTGTIVRF
jgi:hypothetical protein